MSRKPSVPSVPSVPENPETFGDTFKDVSRACHAWLMRRDPTYRKHLERVNRLGSHRPNRPAAC